ncbi:MAG: hypothetical protein AAGI53_10750 [Planctomycetota bacterium]
MTQTAIAVLLFAGTAGAGQPKQVVDQEPVRTTWPSLLLVDDSKLPSLMLEWTRTDGERVSLVAALPYGVDADRVSLGSNVEAYIGVGGTRLSKGAGHPKGSIIKVGFYKVVGPKPFFEGIESGTSVDVTLSGIGMNQPAYAVGDTVLMHLKYNPDDLISCGLPPGARECFNLASPVDGLNDRTQPGVDTRMGVLAEASGSGASSSVGRAEDGTLSVTTSVPYGLFRNILDPWESELPGTFLEPVHFHVEVEVLPEGVEPRDLEAERAKIEAIREQLRELD